MFFDGPAAWLAPQPDPLTQVLEMVINAAMDKVAVAGQTEIAPAAAGQRVHLSTPHFEAHCQRMTSSGTSDHLLLEGDVELFTKRHGQSLRVQGQRIVVHLSDGAFTVEATSTPPQPIAPAPAQSMVPASVFVPVQPAAYIAPLMDWQIVRPVRPVNEWLDLPPKPNE